MKLPQNIDKSLSRKGEYIGYCKGAQRIRRGGPGWITCGLASMHGETVIANGRTLAELGRKLEALNTPGVPNVKRSFMERD